MTNCPGCDADVGEAHMALCDVACCAATGGQRLICNCGACGESVWTGEWPGVAECRAYGLYARLVPGRPGWTPCAKDAPGATEDLNTLAARGRWNPALQRFEMPS